MNVSIVRLGETSLDPERTNSYAIDYEVESLIQHPDYSTITNYNDIALIKLKGNVLMSKFVRPACLHQNNDTNLTNQTAVAIGFGRTGFAEDFSEVLHKVNLTIIHPNLCLNISNNMRLQSQLCLKGKLIIKSDTYGDSCDGR